MTGRNIRPKADKPLPVVDFQEEVAAAQESECEWCGGYGTVAQDCHSCDGVGCDDEGNPCRTCGATGMEKGTCIQCAGIGVVAADGD